MEDARPFIRLQGYPGLGRLRFLEGKDELGRGKVMRIHEIDWSKIEWKKIREGVEQKAFSSDAATVALHRLMPGHEPKPHSHPHEQIAYIMSGRMRFFIGDETRDLGPGGLVVIPPNVRHWGEVLGDEPVMNLDVFTPKRPEYAP
jgi:quercetin dioxygenase-like cupin family protein